MKVYGHRYYHLREEDEDPTPAQRMIMDMLDCAEGCRKKLERLQAKSGSNMRISEGVLKTAKTSGICCLCKKTLTEKINGKVQKIVRHHSHLPPTNFIGLAHNYCNFQSKTATNRFTCYFHNGSNYDFKYLVQAVGQLKSRKLISEVGVIPKSSEKFLSISIAKKDPDDDFPDVDLDLYDDFPEEEDEENETKRKCNKTRISFVDSLSFTLSSLDKLTAQLLKSGSDQFKIVHQIFHREIQNGIDVNLLLRKGKILCLFFSPFRFHFSKLSLFCLRRFSLSVHANYFISAPSITSTKTRIQIRLNKRRNQSRRL
jgi:hypothetical protein